MRILIMTVILGLPLMALGQTTDPQQKDPQTKEPETTAPAKGKKMRPAQEQDKPQAKPETGKPETGKPETGKPETGTDVRGQTDVKSGAQDVKKSETGARSSTSQTTTVNKQEFKSRHTEVFSLGRHPKEFFVQRFGASHFRLIGSTYFVFVDNCWVAVDVEGFVYIERIICPGDPDYIVID